MTKRPTNLLHPTALTTNYPSMHYDAKKRTFTIEDSMLRRHQPGLVYNDACDVGYTLVSHKTGAEVVMAQHQTHYDAEGDVTHWTYKSVWPRNMNLTLTVFND